MGAKKGAINNILNETYNQICKGYLDEVRKRIIKMQISIKTGFNLNMFSEDSSDSEEDINKILDVIRGPEIGLKDFKFDMTGETNE